MTERIRLGISTCLLGENVRYNGGHKRDRFLTDTLGAYVEYVPVCPEVECGLGVPRESMRLVGDLESPRLITHNSHTDHTDRMLRWAAQRVQELEKEDLCGYIFKSKSPSSGMERVKLYNEKGNLVNAKAVGLFARTFMEHFPLLPVEDEGRLHDPNLRENFIERIFALHRYRDTVLRKKAFGALVKFQETHKLLLMSHSPALCRELGRLVANGRRRKFETLSADYEAGLLKALKRLATPGKHVNVLQHMMGYLRDDLTDDERHELVECIEEFRSGLLPLIVPVTLIKHHVRKLGTEYLRDQVYLNPHPLELKLRNHA